MLLIKIFYNTTRTAQNISTWRKAHDENALGDEADEEIDTFPRSKSHMRQVCLFPTQT